MAARDVRGIDEKAAPGLVGRISEEENPLSIVSDRYWTSAFRVFMAAFETAEARLVNGLVLKVFRRRYRIGITSVLRRFPSLTETV